MRQIYDEKVRGKTFTYQGNDVKITPKKEVSLKERSNISQQLNEDKSSLKGLLE